MVGYGFAHDAQIRGENWRQALNENKVDVYQGDNLLGTLVLRVPGQHNISNALAAVAAGLEVGLTFEQLSEALREFSGARRRFQLLGVVQNIQIIDDYAHHPTEVLATIEAAKGVHTGRVVAVFQPHRYSRTKFLAEKFAQAFALADEVVLTDVYAAGEDKSEGAESDSIVAYMDRTVHRVAQGELNSFLLHFVKPGDMVLMMGAGNIWQNSLQLVELLKQHQA